MRMFLVGMCDIFLILYLTTLSQVSPFQNSSITVDDYHKAKEAEAKALEEAQKAIEEKELALANSGKSIEEIKKIRAAILKLEEDKELAELLAKQARDELGVVSETASEAEQLAAKNKWEAENAAKKAMEALARAEKAEKEAANARALREQAMQKQNETRLKMETAKQSEQKMAIITQNAKKEAEEARLREAEALELAKKAREEAARAFEREVIALELAQKSALEKEEAQENEKTARAAQAEALQIADVAKKEVVKTKSEISSITQTADTAFDKNIESKIMPFTVTIQYKNRWKVMNTKEITLKGLPVLINNESVIFAPLDQLGLLTTEFDSDQYITYSISANNRLVNKLYVKSGADKIAAFVINSAPEYSLPVNDKGSFASYMPVLISVRNRKPFGMLDKMRGVNTDFFIFNRDYLSLISEEEFFYKNEGFRGTGDYAEYIIKGDQVVDLDGNFIGLAYKKNSILRINKLDGWQKFTISKIKARNLVRQIEGITNS